MTLDEYAEKLANPTGFLYGNLPKSTGNENCPIRKR